MKREKISEILAKARIQASMDEPTRPTTPMAKMNNKMPEYVPPLTHIATMKRLKVKSPVNTPHEKKRLDNMSSVNAVTQQIRIDILNQLDNINHLYHSKLIYENESTVEHLSETIDTYLKAIKTENIAQSDELHDVWSDVIQTLIPLLSGYESEFKNGYSNTKVKNVTLKILLKLSLCKLSTVTVDEVELNKVIFQCFYSIYESSLLCTTTSGTGNNFTVTSSDGTNNYIPEFDIMIEFLQKITSIFYDPSIENEFMKSYFKRLKLQKKTSKSDMGQNISNREEKGGDGNEKGNLIIDIFDSLNIIYTCLRNYTCSDQYRKYLLHVSIIEILTQLSKISLDMIKRINDTSNINQNVTSSSSLLSDKPYKSIILIFSVLRNFTLDTPGKSKIVSENLATYICDVCNICISNSELVLNGTRILAKLSLMESFRSQLNSNDKNIDSLMSIIQAESQQCLNIINGLGNDNIDSNSNNNASDWPTQFTWPLLSRICFTFGNLTNTNVKNREQLGIKYNCMQHLSILLQACVGALDVIVKNSGNETTSNEFKMNDGNDTTSLSSSLVELAPTDSTEHEVWEATTKMLRLLLNLCINETIGKEAAKSGDVLQLLIDVLECSSSDHIYRVEQEELLLNAVAACTNMSYYINEIATISNDYDNQNSPCKENNGNNNNTVTLTRKLQKRWFLIGQYLASQCLFHNNPEIILEAVKAYGNLSRNSFIIEPLLSDGIIDVFLSLVNHDNIDIANGSIGCLINLSMNNEVKPILVQPDNILILVEKLRKTSFRNLETSTLLCQIFYNLSSNIVEISNRDIDESGSPNTQKNANTSEYVYDRLSDTLFELIDCAQEYVIDKESRHTLLSQEIISTTTSIPTNSSTTNKTDISKETTSVFNFIKEIEKEQSELKDVINKYSKFVEIANLVLSKYHESHK